MKGLLVLLVLSLTACTNTVYQPVPVEPVVIHPAPPAALVLRNVEWRVLTVEEMLEIVADNESGEVVFFALTTQGYEALALNMQELLRYLQEQKQIIHFYRNSFPSKEDDGALE